MKKDRQYMSDTMVFDDAINRCPICGKRVPITDFEDGSYGIGCLNAEVDIAHNIYILTSDRNEAIACWNKLKFI